MTILLQLKKVQRLLELGLNFRRRGGATLALKDLFSGFL